MFIVVYEFEVKSGYEEAFRKAWVAVTKAIYRNFGSLGSRLHKTEKANKYVGYAQWPSKKAWQTERNIVDSSYEQAFTEMRACLISSNVQYQLEVCDDYLQSNPSE